MRHAVAALLVALASPAFAADPPGTISVKASAQDHLPNTVGDAVLGIDAQGKTAAEVQAALSAGSGALVAFLKGANVQRLRTQDAELHPVLDGDPPPGKAARVVGYAGRVRVGFQIEAEKLGALLGDALTHGANTIEDMALRPSDEALETTRNRLAAEATRTGLAQARAVAEAAGGHMGAVQSVNVDVMTAGRRIIARKVDSGRTLSFSSYTPAPTEPGDSDVTATVSLIVEIVP